jgi:2-polyprenyl-3-methyl-5-hydroxy-6-metoxy-1,4-benzoquinol methylase
MIHEWGTKEWFETIFSSHSSSNDYGYDINARASQQFRLGLYHETIKNHVSSDGSVRILDIGCALGDFTRSIKGIDEKNCVVGMDFSENAIRYCSTHHKNIQWVISGLPYLPFSPNAFDIVLCLELLYYLDDDDIGRALNNISVTVRKGGYVLFSCALNRDKRYLTEDFILQKIASEFEIVSVRYIYGGIFNSIERRAMNCQRLASLLLFSCTSDDTIFDSVISDEISDGRKTDILKKIRACSNKYPAFHWLFTQVARLPKVVFSPMLSSIGIVRTSSTITRLLLPNRGKTNIIILAKVK